jgi:hypothetical protein
MIDIKGLARSKSLVFAVLASSLVLTPNAEAALKKVPALTVQPALQASAKNSRAKKNAKKGPPPAPYELVAARSQRVLTQLKSRPLRLPGVALAETELEASASKNGWLKSLYQRNLIEASWATEMLSDKRILYDVLARELGNNVYRFYPKTVGLREILHRRKLINAKGEITASGDEIETALHEEFPKGFLVRPAVGVAPQETGKGLFPNTDQFIVELMTPGNPLYSPAHLAQPVRSHILDTIASGEALVLQENFIIAADVKRPLKSRFYQEVRVHTYEARVVAGAVPERWVQTNLLSEEQEAKAEAFVQQFLSLLPVSMLTRQAWGVDVAVMDNGELRIVDVVTNRGMRAPWSSYLEQPRVIGAYARHFEEHYGFRFAGLSGALIRHNFANYLPYWEKRIEKAKPGLSKLTAYLPPLP